MALLHIRLEYIHMGYIVPDNFCNISFLSIDKHNLHIWRCKIESDMVCVMEVSMCDRLETNRPIRDKALRRRKQKGLQVIIGSSADLIWS
jgi:hypothetical protein